MATVLLGLTGDVMCGRGIDQILGHPGDPTIHEGWLRSALDYVALAEERSGPIPRRVPASYIWGDMLPILEQVAPEALIINLETAVTDRGRPWPGKGIQYRMHPANVACLSTAGIDVAVLANNHVLDWSTPGLVQTVERLRGAGIATAGAGLTRGQAWAPAVVDTPSGSRVLVLAAGAASSGIPRDRAATARHQERCPPPRPVRRHDRPDRRHPAGSGAPRRRRGHERYRGDLGALYLPVIDTGSGELLRLELVPTKVDRFQLTRPPEQDVQWLATTLGHHSGALGTSVAVSDHGRLAVAW